MTPSFQIQKIESKKYIIKRKKILLYPFYLMLIMTKNEFIGDLSHYGDYVMGKQDAVFHSIDEAYDALQQHAMIEGIPEVIVKVNNSKYLF